MMKNIGLTAYDSTAHPTGKQTVYLQVPTITAEWLRRHLTSTAITGLTNIPENGLQKEILITILTSALRNQK